MTSGVMEQLRSYAEEFDAAVAPITLDEVTTEETTPQPLRPSRPRRRLPGWVYAVAAAAIVLLFGVGLALLRLLERDTLPPIESSTTVTETTISEATSTTVTETSVPEATSTTTSDIASTTTLPAEAVGPSGRWFPTMVDLPAGLLMLGGTDFETRLSDLWSFEPDVGWTSLPLTAPKDAWLLAYDDVSDLVWVMAGVSGGEHDFGQIGTWSPATGEWVRIETPGGPPVGSVSDYRVALDTESRRLVFFVDDQSEAWATWVFDIEESQWTRMNPDISPGGRYGAMMDYDAVSDRVILFGGRTPGGGTLSAETWAYDFNTDTWTNMEPATSPPPSSHGSMVYDPVTDRIIIFGGAVDDPSQSLGLPTRQLDTTWAYDYSSNTWTMLETTVSPTPRQMPGMGHDDETGMIVLFGGADFFAIGMYDTWLFDPVTETWAEWASPD